MRVYQVVRVLKQVAIFLLAPAQCSFGHFTLGYVTGDALDGKWLFVLVNDAAVNLKCQHSAVLCQAVGLVDGLFGLAA